jgi:hypothetical protein
MPVDDEIPKSQGRDTEVLSLLVRRRSKAILDAMKAKTDTPKGRLLDAAIEKYGIEILEYWVSLLSKRSSVP